LRWAWSWRPEQISSRLRLDFPGTLVQRSSRIVMLLYLPPMDRRDGPRTKNGAELPVTEPRRSAM
jgi:hypothetical protein